VIFESEDKSYGQFLGNRWTGVVGYVVRKEAEIGLGSIFYDALQRSAVSNMQTLLTVLLSCHVLLKG